MEELTNGKQEELADLLSEAFFSGLKKQMLMGMIASDTVEEILAPLLRDYNRLFPLLSAGLQRDVECILKAYPEIAAHYEVSLKPSVSYVLDIFWDLFKGNFPGDAGDASRRSFPPGEVADLDTDAYAFEAQKTLDDASGTTAAGRSVIDVGEDEPAILEVVYVRGENRFCFECPGLRRKVELAICGRPVLVLQPERNRACLTVREYTDIVKRYEMEGGEGVEIDLWMEE